MTLPLLRRFVRQVRLGKFMNDYHKMSAVITGGASGLGLATAKRLRKAGVKVAIFDMNAELGEKVAKEIILPCQYYV